MKHIFSIFLCAILVMFNFLVLSQPIEKTEVMTLGVFHFSFPNFDVQQTEKEDQIDVLDEKYQKEIIAIVEKLKTFQPTIIVIERTPAEQSKIDSLFKAYRSGDYTLKRNEEEQIGFRVAKELQIEKLYCVDEWGNFSENINTWINDETSITSQHFETYFMHNPDSSKYFVPEPVFKSKGIIEQLKVLNHPDYIKNTLGSYLIGTFKFEEKAYDFAGVDFETGRWFSRNLKIFRNIQRINATTKDKILVIYGAGHLNLLNYFFECSPEYELVSPLPFLE